MPQRFLAQNTQHQQAAALTLAISIPDTPSKEIHSLRDIQRSRLWVTDQHLESELKMI